MQLMENRGSPDALNDRLNSNILEIADRDEVFNPLLLADVGQLPA